ncbi:nitrogen regulatory protein P-II [Oxobacter pfennigii]|uniref:Nitrogen regulatory protein P-II n=1 Tax=Oxobacter pfennigii TaxID=36849 RepID=A0A0P9ACI5_9CLOT|nr:P-II family nitrogen regulator [Oxobacter pfennigii]KPU42812.1 nitrogen regulatory protein P-II [Oxobacter pfennigii]
MKKLEIIIRPDKIDELKDALYDVGVKGMTVTGVMGSGNQKGSKTFYRGTEVNVSLLHKFKIEIILGDNLVDVVIDKVLSTVKTGNIGDGKIFIYNVEDAIRIRTGEKGEKAI